jgi:hypothetical protein
MDNQVLDSTDNLDMAKWLTLFVTQRLHGCAMNSIVLFTEDPFQNRLVSRTASSPVAERSSAPPASIMTMGGRWGISPVC